MNPLPATGDHLLAPLDCERDHAEATARDEYRNELARRTPPVLPHGPGFNDSSHPGDPADAPSGQDPLRPPPSASTGGGPDACESRPANVPTSTVVQGDYVALVNAAVAHLEIAATVAPTLLLNAQTRAVRVRVQLLTRDAEDR